MYLIANGRAIRERRKAARDCLKWSCLSSLALEKAIQPFAGLKDQNIKYILFVPRP